MLARNALMLVAATALTTAVAGAQQPTTKPSTTHSTTAAKKSTSTAAPLPISSDSAKKIVAANESGATVSSAHLHHKGDKAYYTVSYKMKGETKGMSATVDAHTGAFTPAAPSTATTKPAAKKPS
jgi:uncharacterized membrane protein YkoI